jgi:hypothetical protein
MLIVVLILMNILDKRIVLMLTITDFKPETKQSNFIARNFLGFYHEFFITNHTGHYIYVINYQGKISVIAPIATLPYADMTGSGVRIQIKVNPDGAYYRTYGDMPQDINGTLYQTFIPEHILNQDYVYISDLNLVITTEAHKESAKHPIQQCDLQEILRDELEKPNEFGVPTTFAILANDPHNQIDALYYRLNDNLMYLVHVKHIKNQPAFCNIYHKPHPQMKKCIIEKFDFNEIIDGKGVIIYNNKQHFIGVSPEIVQDAYDKHIREIKTDMLKDIEEKYKEKHAEELAAVKKELNEYKREAQQKILGLKTQICKIQSAYTNLKIDYDKAMYLLSHHKGKLEYDAQQLEYQYKLDKAQYDLAKERTSFLGTVGKVALMAIPIVVTLVTIVTKIPLKII